MFQSLADESAGRIGYRTTGQGLSLALHLTAVMMVVVQHWLLALLSALSTVPQPPPPATQALTILAPPPGKRARINALNYPSATMKITAGETAPALADSTDITFDADDTRQLLPVLTAYGGLIVFVPVLDRVHPKGAFRPDGSEAPLPVTLDHWVRIRLPNTSWWPEIDALCSVANSDGTLEAVAVFPPSYRSALWAAVQAHMAETKSAGRVVGVGLRLEAGQPAGVRVRVIRLAGNKIS